MLVINGVGQTRPVGRSHEGLVVGPVIRLSGIGERCVRKSYCLRCSPPKTEVGEGFGAVPGLLEDCEVSPPKPTPGIGRDGVV